MRLDRTAHIERFYNCLSNLTASQSETALRNPFFKADCPSKGVYFFFELSEKRTQTETCGRVVRVGTHGLKSGSKSTLWKRLAQHRGNLSNEGGNHRGSIFRLLIGQALQVRNGVQLETWGKGNTAGREVREQELFLEQAVSSYISQMPVVCLRISDIAGPNSLRGYIERNAIALLSNHNKQAIDPASPYWLGTFSNREKVVSSGLWNSNHVDEEYDPVFLDVLERLVSEQVGT